MEQSLRDFSKSYSSRIIQGGDKWKKHYPNKSNYHQEDVDISKAKENNETTEASEGKSTEAQKYSWGEKYENKDQPRPYGAEMHTYDHKHSHNAENETDHQMNGDKEFSGNYSLEKESEKEGQPPPQSSTTSTEEIISEEEEEIIEEVTESDYSDDDRGDEAKSADISDTSQMIENNEESERDSFINYGYDTTKFSYEETETEGYYQLI